MAVRFLGDGNEFVLASIGRPSLALLADYALKTLNLWFWFGAFASFVYLALCLGKPDPNLTKTYQTAKSRDRRNRSSMACRSSLGHTLAEEQATDCGDNMRSGYPVSAETIALSDCDFPYITYRALDTDMTCHDTIDRHDALARVAWWMPKSDAKRGRA